MNKLQNTKIIRYRSLKPRIEMFNPFTKPFSATNDIEDQTTEKTKFIIVSPKVVEYMIDDNTKIVAKCTPCQCCACR